MGVGFRGVILAAMLVSPTFAREWRDRSGEQIVEAEFVSLEDDVVHFRTPDGEPRRCKLDRLSSADQALVRAEPPARETLTAAKTPAREVARHSAAPQPCAACQPQMIECTVMVPQMVTEMRTIDVVECREEQRQSTYTVCRLVPETRQVTYEYTVPSYETRSREFAYTAFKPVLSNQTREYTVMVPHSETRKATRQVCNMVPVPMTRTICEDHGSWQQLVKNDACGCCTCSRTCNVWIPKLEKREVQYTVMRPQMETVPYEYTATVCRPEKRSETVQVCNYVPEQQKRTVPYTVCVPVRKTATREVTTHRPVYEQKTHTYTVQVPHTVQRQVPVQVCRMVAKKVTHPVPSCGSSCYRGGCGGRGGCGW